MDRESKYETVLAVVHVVASFALLMTIAAVLGWSFRVELGHFGAWFVDRFGFVGMATGAFLADGLHVPIPPQFYLFTGIAGGHASASVIASVLVGSELGGAFAFGMARFLVQHSSFLRARVAAPRRLLTRLVHHKGYLGILIAMLLPVSYCALCMAAGAMGLPYRAYAVLGAMRVPRLLLSYALIALAWHV